MEECPFCRRALKPSFASASFCPWCGARLGPAAPVATGRGPAQATAPAPGQGWGVRAFGAPPPPPGWTWYPRLSARRARRIRTDAVAAVLVALGAALVILSIPVAILLLAALYNVPLTLVFEATATVVICGGGAQFLIALVAIYLAHEAERGELDSGLGLVLAGIFEIVIGLVVIGGLLAIIGGILTISGGAVASLA